MVFLQPPVDHAPPWSAYHFPDAPAAVVGEKVGGLGRPLMHAPLICPPNEPLQHLTCVEYPGESQSAFRVQRPPLHATEYSGCHISGVVEGHQGDSNVRGSWSKDGEEGYWSSHDCSPSMLSCSPLRRTCSSLSLTVCLVNH
jgi:hypothetical protein